MAALHDLVEENITRNSTNVAVIYDDGSVKSYVTYQELGSRANSICGVLRSLVVDNETIGLCMPQNSDLPSVLHGILKTPASFYPFDGDGAEFTRYSLVRLHVRYLLVHIDLLQKVDEVSQTLQGVVVPCMELLDFGLVLVSLQKVKPAPQTPSLAYCITTSGTTSTPKVVRVQHSCILPNITHLRNIFQTKNNDVCFLASPLTFDPSIVEIFVALSSGATLLITSNEVKASPKKLLDVLHDRNKVSVLQMTPTLLTRFRSSSLRSTLLSSASSLRVLALGGEKFPSVDVLQTIVSQECHTKFFNLYGITEVSTWATCFECDASYFNYGQEVPLGPVLASTKVKVIDSEGHDVKKGEGKLLIGSKDRVCMLNDETEEDIMDKTIWRDTGDIVCVTEDGSITYVGRDDDQIKRHGKRLNTLAIEHAVQQLPSVADSRVIFSDQRLLLFLVAKEPVDLVQHATFKMVITSHLQKTLPAHYQPDELILIDFIPVTKHGKTDKKMLLSWWKTANSVSSFTPVDVHLWCQTVWKDYLNHPLADKSIKKSDEFLALGGDSLKAVSVVNCVETATGSDSTSLLDTLLNRSFQDFVQDVQNLLMTQGDPVVDLPVKSVDRDGYNQGRVKSRLKLPEGSAAVFGSGDEEEEDVDTPRLNDVGPRGIHVEKKNTSNMDDMELLSLSDKHQRNKIKSNKQTVLQKGSNVFPNLTHTDKDLGSTANMDSSINLTEGFVGSVSRGSSYDENISGDILLPRNLVEECRGGLMLEERWKYDTGKCVDASPLICLSRTGSHVVYTGSHSHAMCAIDLTTGSELWRTQLGDRVESSACLSQCGRWVVVGCYDNSMYVLCAISGKIKWQYKTDGCVKSSPAVDPVTSHIIIGSHDHCLHAVDIYKERCAWKCCLGTGSVFSSPCVSRYHRHTYIGTLGSCLHAVNTDTGTLIWSCRTDKPIFSSPAENSHCVVIGCVDGSIYSFTHKGHKMWTFPTRAPVFSSPTIVSLPPNQREVVLIGSHDRHLYCVSMTGEELWRWETDAPVYSTPFVVKQRMHMQTVTFNSHINTESVMASSASAVAARVNDVCLNVQQDSLEKELHLQTELSNGVTFESHKSNPDVMFDAKDDSECRHAMRYSGCVACLLLENRSCLNEEEPCIKKQRYDNVRMTDLKSHSEDITTLSISEIKTLQSNLCSSCEKRRVRYGLDLTANQMRSLKDFVKCPCGSMNAKRTHMTMCQTQTDCLSIHKDLCITNTTQIKTGIPTEQQVIKGSQCFEEEETNCCRCQKSSEQGSKKECFCHSQQGQLVCVASTTGTMAVLDGATGRAVASTQLPGEVFSSPVAVGGLAVVGCRDDYIYCYRITRMSSS